MKKKQNLPYIFIFDIDNCIIGDVSYVLYENDILELIRKECEKKKLSLKCPKMINFKKDLNQGLLRPYFKDFIKFIKKKYKKVEIYVYTNSTYSWTHNGLVYNIEKAANIKFNKPYFTRENSFKNFEKSLTNVYNIIINNLNKKYPLLKKKKYINEVFNNNIIFIDDIKDNLADHRYKQLVCPKYEYIKSYNILDKIIKEYKIEKKKLMKNEEIYKYIISNYEIIMDFKNKSLLNKLIPLYSEKMYKETKYYEKLNKKDKFFKNLIKILKKEKTNNLNNKLINKLNKII